MNQILTCRALVALATITLLAQQSMAQSFSGLQVRVVEGENAVNNVQRKAATPVAVEVRDSLSHTVPGARVRFKLPDRGPGGAFADGGKSMVTWTDEKGLAVMNGLVPNEAEGRFSIGVSAELAGREGATAVSQTNRFFARPSAPTFNYAQPTVSRPGSSRKLLVLLGVGAAVAAASLIAVKGSNGRPGAPVTPTTVTVGGVNIGGPR